MEIPDPHNRIPELELFAESLDNLIEKIQDKYPSLEEWQAHVVCAGMIRAMTGLIDQPDVEKGIAAIIFAIQAKK